MPGIPEGRIAAVVVDETLEGRQTFDRAPEAVEDGTALSLPAPAGGICWGIWEFNAQSRDLTSVSIDFTLDPGEEIWVALADYSAGVWDIRGPFTDDQQFALDDAKHKSPGENLYCAGLTSDGRLGAVVSLTLTSDTGNNLPPVAQLDAVPLTGETPLDVQFDASASFDPESAPLELDWDLDGDGLFGEAGPEDENSGAMLVNHTFADAGDYIVRVRVRDDISLTDTEEVQISAAGPNQAPTAVVEADPTSGEAPLAVSFDGSQSSDPEGPLADYEWDLDGDGVYNEAGAEADAQGNPAAAYTYYAAGEYSPALRVTDSEDLSEVATAEIQVSGNLPPTAAIDAAPSEGAPPLAVILSAAGSSDADGSIADYAWDLDGDGAFGETGPEADAAGNSTAMFTYDAAGMFYPAVRVTDDIGATDEASTAVKAYGWALVTLAVGDYYVGTSLAIVDGRPAIAFGANAEGALKYAICSTDYGTAAADWQFVTVDGSGSSWSNQLVVIDGFPTIGYNPGNGEIRFARASTPDGANDADWSSVTAAVGTEVTTGPSLAVIDGKPAVAYTVTGPSGPGNGRLWYARSSSIGGMGPGDWSGVDIGDAMGFDDAMSLHAVNGKPGIAFRSDNVEGLQFFFSSTTEGTSPGDWSSIIVDGTDPGVNLSLALIGGKPAIAYTDVDDLVHFALSSTAGGTQVSDWLNITVDLDRTSYWGLSLRPIGGKPAIAYCDMTNWNLRFAESSTADGMAMADWSTEPADGGEGAGEECSLCEVQGCPAISYFFDGLEQSELRYAIRIQ